MPVLPVPRSRPLVGPYRLRRWGDASLVALWRLRSQIADLYSSDAIGCFAGRRHHRIAARATDSKATRPPAQLLHQARQRLY
ncbi:MAG: hypothetical protein AAF821_26615 [Cyanobacteria bacterium P01_D01_bin.156]